MDDAKGWTDEISTPSPEDLVSFSVVCWPRTDVGYEELVRNLTLSNLEASLPTDQTREGVVAALRQLGFEVFDADDPVVSARGSVRLFEEVFGIPLVKRRRTYGGPGRSRTNTAIVPGRDAYDDGIVTDRIKGAMRVVFAEPPSILTPRLPSPGRGTAVALRVPGDLAQLSGASEVHRKRVSSKASATGHGVGIAVVDTGFAPHPYYDDHAYRITRQAAPDSFDPETDDDEHGTSLLAALFACAPDAKVHAVKFGADQVLAFKSAAKRKGVRVISLSWGYDHAGRATLKAQALALKLQILLAVQKGITVVAAAGNGDQPFPAMMPEVIAVGALGIDDLDALARWPLSSSFVSPVYPARPVPDVCAMGSDITLPVPAGDWGTHAGGTSVAAPQVAALAALLLQKKSSLTPDQVKSALVATAQGIPGSGTTTGAGMVDALAAWQSV